MGHADIRNLGWIAVRQLYAHGEVTIAQMIAFCQKKLAPIQQKRTNTERALQTIRETVKRSALRGDADGVRTLTPQRERLEHALRQLDEREQAWALVAGEGCYGDDGMLSDGFERQLMHLRDHGMVDAVLDTDEKKQWFEEMMLHGIDGHDELWQDFDTIAWKFTPKGRKAYKDKTVDLISGISA